MVIFNASKEWVIYVQPEIPGIKKAVDDLVRYISLLSASDGGAFPKVCNPMGVSGSASAVNYPVITLYSEDQDSYRNGFCWRAASERIEIFGESGRGLRNGIYSFLESLGISWPCPGQEKIPVQNGKLRLFPLAVNNVNKASHHIKKEHTAFPLRRFIPADKESVMYILKKADDFIVWAARQRYDAVIFPFRVFKSKRIAKKISELKKTAGEYSINIEAGGHELTSLLPRKYFFLHPDYFRMESGRRIRARHFCPTSHAAIGIIAKTCGKLFRKVDSDVFHLWPDRGAETVWCSCPSCRAFLPAEQNRIGVAAAADVLAGIKPNAYITFFEKADEDGNVPLRKNLFGIDELPAEIQLPPR